jgi:hypothetical protein
LGLGPSGLRLVWKPPDINFVKINSDGAIFKSVCRNSQGVFVGASTTVFEGITNPEVLEALAVSEALSLGADLNRQHILVASDCANVVGERCQDWRCKGAELHDHRENLAKEKRFCDGRFLP